MDFASTLVHELLNKDKKVDKNAVEREKWASDPQYTQKLYAHIQRQWVPDEKAKKLGVGASLDKVEASLSDDDPRKGLGALAHEEFMNILPHAPKDLHPRQVAAAVYNKMLADKVPDLFNYARKQDTNMLGTGLFGDKYKLGPLQQHYEAWRDEEKKQSPGVIAGAFGKEGLGRYFDKEEAPAAYGMAAGTGAIVTAISEAARRRAATAGAGAVAKMIARGAVASPHPLLKIAGMAALAIPEFMAWDTATGAAKGTEWYRARDVKIGDVGIGEALTSSDWWKTTGVDAALGIAAMKVGAKAVSKGGVALAERAFPKEGGIADVLAAENTGKQMLSDADKKLADSVNKSLAFPSPENLLRSMENKNARDIGGQYFDQLRRTGDDARINVLADYAHTLSGEADAGLGMSAQDKVAETLLDTLSTGKATGMSANQSVAMMAEKLRRGVIEEGGTGLSAETEKKLLKNKGVRSVAEQLKDVKDLNGVDSRINSGMEIGEAIREQKLAESTLGEYYPDTGFGGPEIARSNKIKAFEREQSKVARGRTLMDLEVKASEPVELKAPAPGETAARVEDLTKDELPFALNKEAQQDLKTKLIKANEVAAPAPEDHATKLFNAAIKSPENEVKATNIVSDIMANPAHPDRAVAESYLAKMKAHKESVVKNETLKTAARDADRAATTKIEGDAEEIGNLVNSKDINFFGEAEVVAPESVIGKTAKGPSYADELNVFIKNRKAIAEALKKGGKTIAGVGAVGLALQPGAMDAGTYVNLVKQGLTMDNVSDIDPGAAQAAGIADRQVGKLVTGIFKDVYKNTSDMFTAMKDSHLLAPKIDPANKYVIGDAATGDIQRGVTIVPDPNPRNMITRRKRLPLVFDMLMSPGAKGQIYYGVTNNGREMLNNPIVSAASHHTAALNNTEHMFEVVRNILGEVPGITKDSTMIAAEMKDLNKEYIGKYTTEGYSRFKVEEQAGIIKRAEKDLRKKNLSAEDRTVIQDTLTEAQIQQKIHTDMLKEGEGFWPDFKQRWEQKMQNLTDRSSSSRIALAAEDTANFDHYPWLKGKMTQEELVAAGRIKKVMEQISGYMSEQKMPVISERPYFHHAAHPETNYSELKSILDKFATEGGDEAMRLSKTHARAMNSLQMMPDVFYALDKYLPDINRRIQWNDFWKPGEKNGWAAHANSRFIQDSEGLKKFWDGFKRGFDPVDLTTMDKWTRRMYAFEVARLLSFSPSVALKHAIKLEANWSNFGISESAKVLPKSLDLLRRMRFTKDVPQDMETTAARSFTNQGRLYQQAMDFDTYEVPQSFWDKAIEKWNDKGSILLDTTERFDRGHSFLAASEMAMKQGMTPAQAAYSIYDTILKTNFLSGPMNPHWLRDPKIRMMLMFQGTPFKILEQRAIQAYRAGRGVKDHYETLQALKSDIKEGEFKFKTGMIMDALKREQDIYGTPIAQQLMRKMLIMGTVVMGGKMAFDADLWSHFSHPPFFKAQQSEFGVAAMPVAQAAHQAYGKERGEDDYFVSDFFNAWLKDGLLQSQFIKANRLSKDDIPERYKGSGLKYVFGIPAVADKNKQ